MIGIFLSLLFPGLGQFYYGKNGRGILMLALGLSPLYPIALLWSVWDAVKLRNREIPPKENRREAVMILVLGFIFIPIACIVVGGTLSFMAARYNEKYGKEKNTRREMEDMIYTIDRYKSEMGKYPERLSDIMEGHPPRATWLTDSWGRHYIFELSEDGEDYVLLSLGKDGVKNTQDDLVGSRVCNLE